MSKPSDNHYQELKSGYVVNIDNYQIEPILFQPTPTGLETIAQHYNKKYGINIAIVNDPQQGPSTITKHFKNFYPYHEEHLRSVLRERSPIGIILTNGQKHAIPIILSQEGDKKYMIIMDSTIGDRKRSYYTAANKFPEYTILLGKGARQVDSQSCLTDAICVLKDGLRINNLGSRILRDKLVPEDEDKKNEETQGNPHFQQS
jgi:hypothetical protein